VTGLRNAKITQFGAGCTSCEDPVMTGIIDPDRAQKPDGAEYSRQTMMRELKSAINVYLSMGIDSADSSADSLADAVIGVVGGIR